MLAKRRLQGVPLHHRGSGRRRAPARCRLRGADALGRADRHRPRPRQPLCAARPCAPISPTCRSSSMPASARPRMRPQAMEMGFDAVLLNTAVAKAARSGAHGRGLRAGHRGRPHRLRGRPDGDARHGRTRRRRWPARRSSISRLTRTPETSPDKNHERVSGRLLSDRARRRLARAPGAARRQDRPAAPQGRRPRDACAARSPTPRSSRSRHGCQLDRQRLLARGASTSAPTTSIWARRIWRQPTCGHQGRGHRASASPRTAEEELDIALAAEPGLRRAGADLRDQAQGMKWARRASSASPNGRSASALCRWSPSAASRPSARAA